MVHLLYSTCIEHPRTVICNFMVAKDYENWTNEIFPTQVVSHWMCVKFSWPTTDFNFMLDNINAIFFWFTVLCKMCFLLWAVGIATAVVPVTTKVIGDWRRTKSMKSSWNSGRKMSHASTESKEIKKTYSSKFLWHNIFVNFVIRHQSQKFVTKNWSGMQLAWVHQAHSQIFYHKN